MKEKIFRLEVRLGDPNITKMGEYEAKTQELQTKLAESHRGERKLCEEMNEMGKVIDDLQGRVMQSGSQLTEKDSVAAQMMMQSLETKQREDLLRKERDALQQKIATFERMCGMLAEEKRALEAVSKNQDQVIVSPPPRYLRHSFSIYPSHALVICSQVASNKRHTLQVMVVAQHEEAASRR